MIDLFGAPIPGQSLTTEPKNAPYENPPEIVDPEEALMFHLDRLSDPDRMEAILMLLENDAPVSILADNILRNAVAGGMHTVDVSLIIKKPVEEWIAGTAKEVGVPFLTGYEKEDGRLAREKHAELLALRSVPKDVMEITQADKKQAMALSDEQQGSGMPDQEQQEQPKEQQQEPMAMEQQPQEEQAPVARGLMARV
jgi:hypothetical protein